MRALIAAIVALTHGCSFLFVVAPAPTPPGMYPVCSSSLMWPIVDGVLAASMTASAVGIAQGEDRDVGPSTDAGMDPDMATGSLLTTGAMAVAFAASAVIGYRNVQRCDRMRHTFQREALAGPPQGMGAPASSGAPPPWPAPQVGAEGGLCAAERTCAPGLVCASELCVRPPMRAPAPAPADAR